MGTSALLRFWAWRLTILLALGHVTAIRGSDVEIPDPEGICPCVVREECPREFGSVPEDALLGSFSACLDPDSVRCCGVSTSVSVSHSDSSSVRKTLAGEIEDIRNKNVRKSLEVIPYRIVAPVPLLFPEYVDHRPKSTKSTEDEDSLEKMVEFISKPEEGEHIDDTVSQSGAFVFSDHIDQRSVNNKDEPEGGASTVRGNGQRGIISSSKAIESTSASSGKKIQRVEANGDTYTSGMSGVSDKEGEGSFEDEAIEEWKSLRKPETFAEIGVPANSQYSVARDANPLEFEPSSEEIHVIVRQPVQRQRNHVTGSSTRLSNDPLRFDDPQVSTHQNSEKVTKESFDEEQQGHLETSSKVSKAGRRSKLTNVNQERERATNYTDAEDVVHDGRPTTPNYLKTNNKILSNESKNSEKSDTSNVESFTLAAERQRGYIGKTDGLVSGRRKRPSAIPWQRDAFDLEAQTAFRSKGRIDYGKQQQNSPQQTIESGNKESSVIMKVSSDSIAQGFNMDTDDLKDEGADFGSRDAPSYGQRLKSSQQKIEATKPEFFNVHESSAPNVQSTRNTESEDLLSRGVAFGSKSNAAYGQRHESSSQQTYEFVKETPSNEEDNVSNDTSITMKTATLPQDNVNLELYDATSVEKTSYGQQKPSSFYQQSEGAKQESSISEVSSRSFPILQEINPNTRDLLNAGILDQATYGQRVNVTSTQEGSVMLKNNLSNMESSSLSKINQEDTTRENTSAVDARTRTTVKELNHIFTTNKDKFVHGQITAMSSTPEETISEKLASESTSTENVSSTSSLVSLLTGKMMSRGSVETASRTSKSEKIGTLPSMIGRDQNTGHWYIGNGAYVPVLINAGFLRDRSTSTRPMGLDLVFGVTHGHILNPDPAPELLPLSCGNVIFGERFKDGRTLICEIPQENLQESIGFSGLQNTFIPGKLQETVVPEACTVAKEAHGSIGEIELAHTEAAVIVKGDVRGTTKERGLQNILQVLQANAKPLESQDEESSTTTTLDRTNIDHHPWLLRGKIFLTRPTLEAPVLKEGPDVMTTSTVQVNGIIRHSVSDGKHKPEETNEFSAVDADQADAVPDSTGFQTTVQSEKIDTVEAMNPNLTSNKILQQHTMQSFGSSEKSSLQESNATISSSFSNSIPDTSMSQLGVSTTKPDQIPVIPVPSELDLTNIKKSDNATDSGIPRRIEEFTIETKTPGSVYPARIRIGMSKRTKSRPKTWSGIRTVKSDAGIDWGRLAEGTTSLSSNFSPKSSLQESPPSSQKLSKLELDPVSSAEQVNEAAGKWMFYLLPMSSIHRPIAASRGVDEITRKRVGKKRLRINGLSTLIENLPTNDTKVVNRKATMREDATRPGFFYVQRSSRQVKEPSVRDTISAQELSMAGRLNVIGPIPHGYKDPALFPEPNLTIEPPNGNGPPSFLRVTAVHQTAVARDLDLFNPSPIDPINWP